MATTTMRILLAGTLLSFSSSFASANPMIECDELAAAPDDPARPARAAGVPFDEIQADAAIAACQAALDSLVEGDSAAGRMHFQLGRALVAADRSAEALPNYRAGAEAGHNGARALSSG